MFIGRTDELAALHAARRALAQSQGSLVLIAGEAGIGKTRLLGQFLSIVERDSRRRNLASAECLEFAEQPFGAIRELYAALGGTFPGSQGESLEKREIFARIVEDLRGLATQRATILTIEDLHWADRSTLEFLVYLAPRIRGTRLLLLATYRSEELSHREALSTSIARLARESTIAQVSLDPLDAKQMRELIGHATGERRAPPKLVLESVARRSEGNPFYAEELLKDALDSRYERDDTIPFSIRASVTERLGSLDATDRRILAHAAVLGYRFDPQLLALTMQTSIDEIVPALRRARDLNVLVEEHDAPDLDRFRFRHALTRDVVYEATLRFDAKRTHEHILTMLESLEDSERHIDALAYHAWAARNLPKIVRYNALAGDAALRMRALHEARTFYERVIEAVEKGGRDEALRRETFAQIVDMEGKLALAAEQFEIVFHRYLDAGDVDGAATAMRQLAATRNNLGDSTAFETARRFADAYDSQIGNEAKGALLAMLARLATILYDFESTTTLLDRIPACGPLPARARQNELIARMDLSWYRGDIGAWREIVPSLVEIQDDLPPFTSLPSLLALGQSASSIGFVKIADDAFARASRIEGLWDFGAIANHGAALRAFHAFTYGRVAETRAEIARARAGSIAGVATMALAIVAPLAAATLDDPTLMSKELEDHIAETRVDAVGPDSASILAGAAAWYASRGRLAEARADLRVAIRLLPRPLPSSGSLLALAATHLEGADLHPLHELLAMPLLDSDRAGHAGVILARAILAQRFDSPAAARELALSAAAEFRKLGWPFFEARAFDVAGADDEARATYARIGLAKARTPQKPATSANTLSKREDDVARQIATGATNAEIAERLSISLGTVEKHVTSIFEKLDVKRRSQIAAKYANFQA